MSPLHSDCRPKSSLYNVPLSFSLPLASFRSPCPSPRSCVVPKSFSQPDFPTLSLPYSLYLPPQDLLPFQQQWHYRKPRGIIRETLDKIDFTPGHAHRQALPPPPPTHNSSSYSLLLLANSLSLFLSMHHLWFSEIRDVFPRHSPLLFHMGRADEGVVVLSRNSKRRSPLFNHPPFPFFSHRLPPFFYSRLFPFHSPFLFDSIPSSSPFPRFPVTSLPISFSTPVFFFFFFFFFSYFPSLEEEEN